MRPALTCGWRPPSPPFLRFTAGSSSGERRWAAGSMRLSPGIALAAMAPIFKWLLPVHEFVLPGCAALMQASSLKRPSVPNPGRRLPAPSNILASLYLALFTPSQVNLTAHPNTRATLTSRARSFPPQTPLVNSKFLTGGPTS